MNRRIAALMVAGGLLMASNTQAATITYVGADVTTNANWRTTAVAKPLDLNGDDYYGTDGYHVYTGDGWMSSLPSYISSVESIVGGPYTEPAFPDFDDPSEPPGSSVPDVDSGAAFADVGGEGVEHDLVRLTLNDAADFRLCIITDEYASIHTPSKLRVSGSGADSGLITLDDNDADIDYYFFDISGAAADQFVVSAVARAAPVVTIGGLAFDTPEPSSLVLLLSLLLPGGFLVRRLRRRR